MLLSLALALALALTLARQPNQTTPLAQHGWNPRQNVLIHPHMHKTAGTSLIDAIMGQARLKSCLGNTHALHSCIDGWAPIMKRREDSEAHVVRAMHDVEKHPECNFLSCEINLDRALGLSRIGAHDGRSRVVLQLRSPSIMISSMFNMCQERSKDGRHVFAPFARFEAISLDGWLRAVDKNDGSAERFCAFDPRNEMVHRLSPYLSDGAAPVADLGAAQRWVARAFHVGIQEEYRASLCLLLTRLRKAGPSCSCTDGHAPSTDERPTYSYGPLLTHGGPLEKDHSAKVEVSSNATALIRSLAALDFELFALAKQRFLRDLDAWKLSCLLGTSMTHTRKRLGS